MSQFSIKLSDKADALIAQLQKEIFNRRRKKVTASGVVETLVESGARSQSDKRFATSWVNLIQDIEKAAKLANAHGSKPSSLTDEEWVMVLSHRNRQATNKPAAKKRAVAAKAATTKAPAKRKAVAKAAAKAVAKAPAKKSVTRKSTTTRAAKKAPTTSTSVSTPVKPRPARRARKATKSPASAGSVAGRMAKAAAQLVSSNGVGSPARS